MKLFTMVVLMVALSEVFCGSKVNNWEKKEQLKRNLIDKVQGNMRMTKAHYARRTQSVGRWRPLRIWFNLTSLNRSWPSRANFYRKVFDIVKHWYGGALYVRDSMDSASSDLDYWKRRSNDYEFNLPRGESWTDYDLFVNVSTGDDRGSVLAWAGPRVRHPETQRPITGITAVTDYGHRFFERADDSINRAVGTILHEFGHVIAFIGFTRYQRKHLATHEGRYYVWKGPIVLQKAGEYYGCSRYSAGVPLQNKDGQPGGHWNEALLADELMTPQTGAKPEKVSAMTLGLFEDTEWYKANYSYVETYSHNKDGGCGLAGAGANPGSCPPATCRVGSQGFITADFIGVGYCNRDSSGCAIDRKFSNRICTSASTWGGASTDQQYGATFGNTSAAIAGSFKRKDGRYIYTKSKLCLKATCTNTHSSYTLQIMGAKWNGSRQSGDVFVRCTRSGTKKYNEGSSVESSVECHDPQTFCEGRFGARGAQDSHATCHNSCGANGRCQVRGSGTGCWCYSDYRVRSRCPSV